MFTKICNYVKITENKYAINNKDKERLEVGKIKSSWLEVRATNSHPITPTPSMFL